MAADSHKRTDWSKTPLFSAIEATVTDAKCAATQWVVYMPYGGGLADQHSTRAEMPWKFNAKELDAETGLYYYGARYYEPGLAVWYGVDALCEKYPSMGGYVYCAGNPVRLVDVDGSDWYEAEDGSMQYTNKHYESQEDFDHKSGVKGRWLGFTYTNNEGTYFSLFGQQITKQDKNYWAYKLIDESIISFNESQQYDNADWSSEPHSTKSVDFSKLARSPDAVEKRPACFRDRTVEYDYCGARVYVHRNRGNLRLKFQGTSLMDRVSSGGYATPQGYRMHIDNHVSVPIVVIVFSPNSKRQKDDFLSQYNNLFKLN